MGQVDVIVHLPLKRIALATIIKAILRTRGAVQVDNDLLLVVEARIVPYLQSGLPSPSNRLIEIILRTSHEWLTINSYKRLQT